jgi:hypothetical protein
MRWTIHILLGLFLATTATASPTIGLYNKLSKSNSSEAKRAINITDNTIADTVMITNAYAEKIHGKPLFCMPQNKAIDGEEVKSVLASQKKLFKAPNLQDKPVASLAVIALADKYPCHGSKKHGNKKQ